jgi:hypothetical protein
MPRTRRRVREPNRRQDPEKVSDAELQRIADKELLDIGTPYVPAHWMGWKTRAQAETEQGPGHNVARAAARKRTQARKLKAAQDSIAKRVRERRAKGTKLRSSDTY